MAGLKNLFVIISLITLSFVCASRRIAVYTLTEDNWDEMLEGEWMVEFYAPWCPACKALQPVWDEFSNWSADLRIKVAKVDVTKASGLSGRFIVTALPTVYHVLNGEFRQYRGGRDKDSLISFIEDKKWNDIEPVPAWKSPGSIQMSIVSYFFKLSSVLRSLHSAMVEEYGIPTWCSYSFFAMGTIVVGAFLGLLMVCVIDCFCPPKSHRPSPLAPVDENEEGDERDDLIDEGAESGPGSQPETQSEGEEEDEEDNEEPEGLEEGEISPNMRKRRPRKAD